MIVNNLVIFNVYIWKCYNINHKLLIQVLVHGQGWQRAREERGSKTDRLLRGLARNRVGGMLLMAIIVLSWLPFAASHFQH